MKVERANKRADEAERKAAETEDALRPARAEVGTIFIFCCVGTICL